MKKALFGACGWVGEGLGVSATKLPRLVASRAGMPVVIGPRTALVAAGRTQSHSDASRIGERHHWPAGEAPASWQPSKAICLFGGDAFQDHGLDVVGLIWPVSQEFGHLVWRVSHFIFSPMAAACV